MPIADLTWAGAVLLQIEKCRGIILDCIRLCDEAGGDRPIPQELFDDDGELDECHIFCARCTDYDTSDEACCQMPALPASFCVLHSPWGLGACNKMSQGIIAISALPLTSLSLTLASHPVHPLVHMHTCAHTHTQRP